MKRTSVNKSDEGARGPWIHLGAAVLLCLAAAAVVVLCVIATPARADAADPSGASGAGSAEQGDWNGDGHVDLLDLDAAVAVVLGEVAGPPTARDSLVVDLNGDGALDVSDVVALIDRIAPTLTSGLASGVLFSTVPESPIRFVHAAPPWVIENADHCARLAWDGPRSGAAVIDLPRDDGPAGTPAASVATDDIETTSSLFWIDSNLRFTVCAKAPEALTAVATSVDGRPRGGDPERTLAIFRAPIDESVSVTIGPALIVEDGYRVVYTEKVIVRLARPFDDDRESAAPLRTGLLASYPNPFNPAVTIPYELAAPSRATLSIYDALGRRVVTLIENAPLPAGPGSVVWRGRDTGGRTVTSGAYFAVLRNGAVRDVRTMILLR